MNQKIKKFKVQAIFFLCILIGVPGNSFAAFWSTVSLGNNTDTNVYKYAIPYTDTYSLFDLGLNLKDKVNQTTRLFLNYNFRNSIYDTYSIKDYSQHLMGFNLDKDLMSIMVAGMSLQGDNYVTSYSQYNYLDLSGKFYLRFFMFFWEYTNIDIGTKYGKFNYYNYNFGEEGWTPSLSYREEVSDYNGAARFVSIKQGLPNDREMELKVSIEQKSFPERPLYERQGSSFIFTDTKRKDNETNIYIGAVQSFKKNSKLSLGISLLDVSSNANLLVYDPLISGSTTTLQEKYYDRKDKTLNLNGLYYYGAENSYFRMNTNYILKDYAQRKAQDIQGTWLSDLRSDQQMTVLLEINQMLGRMGGVNWILRLSYNYDKNKSNDYYYNYTNESFSLGLVSYFYL